MIILLLGLLTYEQPEDTALLYGMDMVWAEFSRQWEDAYDTSLNGFRTSQGSHDMFYWYQRHEAKVEVEFAEIFKLRYRYYARFNLDTAIHWHRVEPMIRILPGFHVHFFMYPFYEKRYDQLGSGLSYRLNNRNWIECFAVIQGVDHNNSMRHQRPGPNKDPFSKIPYRFEVDGRGELNWVKARIHAEIGTPSVQYLDWPDSSFYIWERDHDRSRAWGRLEFQPVSNLWVGSRFSWMRDRSQTRWPEQDSVIADTLTDRWIQPFISWSPTERVELLAEQRLWLTDREMDSVTYHRDLNVFSGLVSWSPWEFMALQMGYQYQWRYSHNNDTLIPEPWSARNTRARLMLIASFKFKSGLMFTVKDGIRMDPFPRDPFKKFHYHTYVSIYLPLDILSPKKEEEGNKKGSQSIFQE